MTVRLIQGFYINSYRDPIDNRAWQARIDFDHRTDANENLVGYGLTESEAIESLLRRLDDENEELRYRTETGDW